MHMERNISQFHLGDINSIPSKTWNHLKMNEVDLTIPSLNVAEKEQRPQSSKSNGYEIGPSALPSEQKRKIARIQTGSGENLSCFIVKNDNAGCSIRIDGQIKKPIEIAYELNQEYPTIIDNTSVLIEKEAKATIVQTYRAKGEGDFFHAGSTHVKVGPYAQFTLVQIQMTDSSTFDFQDTGFELEEGAQVSLIQVLLDSQHTYAGAKALLQGEGSSFHLGCIYLGDGIRTIDTNYVVEHHGKKTTSNITARGVLLDSASKMFRGTIDFKSGTKGSKGSEEEFALLFGPSVDNKSVPLILCGEEDVEGAHAVSSGRIDANALLYLMSRGLDQKHSKKLLIKGQFFPVAKMIEDEVLRQEILDTIERRLENHEY